MNSMEQDPAIAYYQRVLSTLDAKYPDVVALASLASLARRIEPGLLRVLRLGLAKQVDTQRPMGVGTESRLWFSELVESRSPSAITLNTRIAHKLRDRLQAFSPEVFDQCRSLIEKYHQKLPAVLQWEERLYYLGAAKHIPAQEQESHIRIQFSQLANTMRDPGRKSLDHWLEGAAARVPPHIRSLVCVPYFVRDERFISETHEQRITLKDIATAEVIEAPSYPNAATKVADGTNIPKGTKFVLQQRSWRADLYIPGEENAISGWTHRLIKLKREFEWIVENEPVVSCRVIQMRIPEFPGRENIKSWYADIQPDMIQIGGGLSKEFVQLADTHRQTLFGAFAFSDIQGEPVQNSAGEPFAFRYGFSRSRLLYRADVNSQIGVKLSAALERGTELIFELPSSIAVHIWKYWQEGFSRRDNLGQFLWIDALFELGWQAKRSNDMYVPRFAQSQRTKVELRENGHFPRLPKNCSPEVASQIKHENGFPVQIYSEIEDIARRSLYVIEELIGRAAGIELERAKLLDKQGMTNQAEQCLLLSLDLFQEFGDRLEVISTLKFLATMQNRKRRYLHAVRSLQRALEIEMHLGLHGDALTTQLQLSQVLVSLGKTNAAIDVLTESSRVAMECRRFHEVHERNLMAAALKRGRGEVKDAHVMARDAVEFAAKQNNASLLVTATIELASCLFELNQLDEADNVLQRLLADARNSENYRCLAMAKLLRGKILNSLFRPREALVVLQSASELLGSLGEIVDRAESDWAMAKSFQMLGEQEKTCSLGNRARDVFLENDDERGHFVDEWLSKLANIENPRVLISYSHDSDEHAARVAKLANQLREDGVNCWIDQFEPHPAQGWPMWMEQQVKRADAVLLICTDRYAARFNGSEVPGVGRGVIWESILIRNELYQLGHQNNKFIAVGFEPGFETNVPAALRGSQHYLLRSFDLENETGYKSLYRRLSGQNGIDAAPVGPLKPHARQSIISDIQTVVEGSRLLVRSLVSPPRCEAAYAMRFLGFDGQRPMVREFIDRNHPWIFQETEEGICQRVREDFRVSLNSLRSTRRVPFALAISDFDQRGGLCHLPPDGKRPLVVLESAERLREFLADNQLFGKLSPLREFAILRHVLVDEPFDIASRKSDEVQRVLNSFAASRGVALTNVFWGGGQQPPASNYPSIKGHDAIGRLFTEASISWE